ncbi:uncharacterized protein [Amphiura filiformis]|uniref:uncharacterized protein isoform X2 n=1 Tax=Amphiura filiformis TaxID=82378 RepID=UPI003B226ED0
MTHTKGSRRHVRPWRMAVLQLDMPVVVLIVCITGLVAVVNAQDCSKDNAAVTSAGRLCGKACNGAADCRRNRECVCDDICGKTCIATSRVDYCDEVPASEGVILTYNHPNRTFHAQVRGQCEDGYQYEQGNNTRICQGDANWSADQYTCVRIICTNPPVVQYASVNQDYVKESYNVNEWVFYTCDYGYYRLGGYNGIQCTGFEQWSTLDSSYECRPKTCPRPDIDNAYFDGLFEFGSTLTVRCNTGYELQGLPYTTCQGDQTWSGYTRSCNIVQCPALSAPSNGIKRGNVFEYQREVRYECSEGYILEGSKVRQCQADGSWNGQPASCRAINCGEPICHYPNFPNLTTLEGGNIEAAAYTYSSVAYFTCNGGRRREGSVSADCTNQETWRNPCPKCKESADPEFSDPKHMTVDTDLGKSTAEVAYTEPIATDNSGLPPYVTYRRSDGLTGNVFGIGITTLFFTAIDPSDNEAEVEVTITVLDNEVPVLVSGCPEDITKTLAIGEGTAQVEWNGTATDNHGVNTVTCSPSSGMEIVDNIYYFHHVFNIDSTEVWCTATDLSGNTATCSFGVTIIDLEPPVFVSPLKNITVLVGTNVNFEEEVIVTDNDKVINRTCNPSSGIYPIGKTTVMCIAVDAAGNQANHSFLVIVEDKTLFSFDTEQVYVSKADPKVDVSILRQGNVSQADKVCVSVTDSSCQPLFIEILNDYCSYMECVEFEPQQTKPHNISLDFGQCLNGAKKKTNNKQEDVKEFFNCLQLKMEGTVTDRKEYGSSIKITYEFKSPESHVNPVVVGASVGGGVGGAGLLACLCCCCKRIRDFFKNIYSRMCECFRNGLLVIYECIRSLFPCFDKTAQEPVPTPGEKVPLNGRKKEQSTETPSQWTNSPNTIEVKQASSSLTTEV